MDLDVEDLDVFDYLSLLQSIVILFEHNHNHIVDIDIRWHRVAGRLSDRLCCSSSLIGLSDLVQTLFLC
jgi:hypothetical protein